MSSFTKLGLLPGRVVLVGDCGSKLAEALRACGQDVTELTPSDFEGAAHEMADVVAVMPDCEAPERIGAVATACARSVWFQDRKAPRALATLLRAAGVPLFEGGDLAAECPS